MILTSPSALCGGGSNGRFRRAPPDERTLRFSVTNARRQFRYCASHVGPKAVCNNPTNMPDHILRSLAAKGGWWVFIRLLRSSVSGVRDHPPAVSRPE